MVEAEFGLLQVPQKGVFGHALELLEAGFGKAPERLDAVDMRGPVDELILAVADAKKAVEAHVHQAVVAAPAVGEVVAPYVRTSGYGRPPLHAKRELLDAIFYRGRAGCAWHLLQHDLPPWRTVYKQFEAWREDGTCDRLLDSLRRAVRQPKRAAEPTAGAIDTQSGRTGTKRGAVTATMQVSK